MILDLENNDKSKLFLEHSLVKWTEAPYLHPSSRSLTVLIFLSLSSALFGAVKFLGWISYERVIVDLIILVEYFEI